MPALPVTLRTMVESDVAAGLRLCRQSHWNQVDRDWRQFLRQTPGGAAVAVGSDGEVVGSVATIRYATLDAPGSLAWIAMVLVDRGSRGGGIGRALLHHALDLVSDVPAVGLDATPLGQPLYETLGFRADSCLMRLQRSRDAAPAAGTHGSRTRRAVPTDLDAMAALDATATGLDRRAMIAWLLDGAPELAWVSDGPQGIDGVVLGRHGHDASQLGPIIATSRDVAGDLIGACVRSQPSTPFFLDVADDRPGWRAAVERLGFEPQRPFTRMYRGPGRPAGDASRLFAIIGPEFG